MLKKQRRSSDLLSPFVQAGHYPYRMLYNWDKTWVDVIYYCEQNTKLPNGNQYLKYCIHKHRAWKGLDVMEEWININTLN